MNRRLLTPGWVLLHLVFVAAAVTTFWLGWWQWQSAHEAGGSFRNLGYALQWPLFGVFTLFLWYQVARMDRDGSREEHPDAAAASEPETAQAPEDPEVAAPARISAQRKRSPVPPPAPPVDTDEDPELAAYNQYLKELNEADQHRRRP